MKVRAETRIRKKMKKTKRRERERDRGRDGDDDDDGGGGDFPRVIKLNHLILSTSSSLQTLHNLNLIQPQSGRQARTDTRSRVPVKESNPHLVKAPAREAPELKYSGWGSFYLDL
ncbi:hypothetical protein RUM43_009433 [Polyplax serrata]|uniref:Uncharacterized protein n=1 Tax=Polyplax serrata TaxID=468196 RepID=A0AAN8S166_POLSC